MRITSSMMTNNMMLNVNRSMRNVDNLWQEFATGRRVNVPSDNPLIAARAMKFRTNLVANEDFQNNVENALAWMDVTEAALDGVVQILMLEARDIMVRGTNDTLALEDREALVTDLRHIMYQLGHQMNATFAGRFVFSGLRTDQPPIFTQDQPELSFQITQNFTLSDIERTRAIQMPEKFPDPPSQTGIVELPTMNNVHILKLAYTHVDIVAGEVQLEVPGFEVRMLSANDRNAFVVPDAATNAGVPIVHYIPETGELVFNVNDVTGAAAMTNFPSPQGIDVTFTRTGFHTGELNPAVNFQSTLLHAPHGHSLRHLWEISNDPLNPNFPDASAVMFNFPGDNQTMEYEFSTHTTIGINTLARDVLTDKLFADLNRAITFVESIVPSNPEILRQLYSAMGYSGIDLDNAVARHIGEENAAINAAINSRFNNMIFLIDRHAAAARREYTDAGSRGRRLLLFQNRLEQDEGSLYRLKSTNEDADLIRLTSLMAAAEAQLMAATRVGTNIIQTTLLNFLQV